jgi:hypothetical protein
MPNGTTVAPAPNVDCAIRDALIAEAEDNLLRLAELAKAEASAIRTQSHSVQLEIDLQIEHYLGEKERALGRLHQHRIEHGC